ncbi:MAG: hexose kinase [Actinomycetia bacterium]|nr:hexose kinase [Actinomycetes bacterium]
MTRGPLIATVTVNPALDVSVEVESLVADIKVPAVQYRRDPGGGGVNVSRMLARLGSRARTVVVVGGSTGDELVSKVEAEGLRVDVVPIDGQTRENLSVTDRTTGEQYRIVVPGAAVDHPDHLIDVVVSAVGDSSVVILSGGLAPGLDVSFYRRIAERLDEATVIVDALEPQVLADVVTGSVAIVKPNVHELGSIVDIGDGSDPQLAVAARSVLERGSVEAIVLSLGSRGALLVRREGPPIRFVAPRVAEVVSTTGAGDSLVAGIAHVISDGGSMSDAVLLGVAAGAATVAAPGTQLGSHDEVRGLVGQVKVRTVEIDG